MYFTALLTHGRSAHCCVNVNETYGMVNLHMLLQKLIANLISPSGKLEYQSFMYRNENCFCLQNSDISVIGVYLKSETSW